MVENKRSRDPIILPIGLKSPKHDNLEKTVSPCWIIHGHLEVPGRSTRSKNFKTPFFEDICDSFNEGTHIGPEPHQLFSF